MAPFDPYHIWLGIPETERPISKYRLLALVDFENNREVISAAAERQTVYLRMLQAGEHAVLVAKLLNEVSQARVTLLNADQKAEYDEQLRKEQTPEPVPEPVLAPTPVITHEPEPKAAPILVVNTPKRSPILVADSEPATQESAVSIVQPVKRPRRRRQKEILQRPAVIGVSLGVLIGVFLLLVKLMFSGDADSVATNSVELNSAEIAADKAAADNAAAAKAATVTAAVAEGDWKTVLSLDPDNSKGKQMQAADKAAADNAAAVKAAYVINALVKRDWKTVLALDPDNSKGLQMQATAARLAAEKAAAEKAAAEKSAAEKSAVIIAAVEAELGKGNWRGVLALDPKNKEGLRMQAAAQKATAVKAAANKAAIDKAVIKKAAILSGDVIINTIGMTLKEIPAGTFLMGSPDLLDDPGRRNNEQQHKVTLTKPFYMQTTEVTQEQWTAVMGTEPWKGKVYVKEGPDYAATYVSWNDAVAYCKKLSEKEDKTYRLPTEAEWEYACRAGTQTRWSFGDDEKALGDYAWYRENAYDIDERYAHQVELKKPNAFGLYDMHGNVWEWCHDYYVEDYYKQSPAKDPMGPASGSSRVLRGGSWFGRTRYARSAGRGRNDAGARGSGGFRLVRELD